MTNCKRSELSVDQSEIQFWLTDQELEGIFSGEYWNDEEKERKKEWYILDGNTNKLINYLKKKTTYFEEYESIINFAGKKGLSIEGTGIDIATGVCWTTALLSRIETVDKIYALEISKHRLLKIAPVVSDLFNANKQKIIRVIGSFYDIKLPDKTIDFCFMSQAFHHADRPEKLLSEIWRILKPSGFILIIGEQPIFTSDFLKKYIKNVIKMIMPLSRFKSRPVYKLFPTFRELFPPDVELGDHRYRIADYSHIFKQNGFHLYQNNETRFTNFIAKKE